MSIQREALYRFPWSKTDNPGAWVEVTDECDLTCRGCYRHRIQGHRPLAEVQADILECKNITNCDSMAIAGGEPLLYPYIVDVVRFISDHKIKPVILTNGEKLTWEFARELKKAGLAKFHFHMDSFQERPGWTGKTEAEINKLREHYADLVWQLGGIQCGYNVTIYRSTLKYLPDIIDWCRANIHKVQHISLIAFRAIPLRHGIDYLVNGEKIDPSILQNSTAALEEINITTDEMYGILEEHFGDIHPCAYLGGTTSPKSYKYLIIAPFGSRKIIYGVLGAETIELVQVFYHLFQGRYCAFLKNPVVGKKVFLLASFDKHIRRSAVLFLKKSLKNPRRFLDKIYAQTIHLQQPNEILDGEVNLCDGCANMMIYKGKLINSCRLDEYRMFGGLLTAQQVAKISNENVSDHQGSE